MSEHFNERDKHLRGNVLAWIVLRHFLTADLLRHLSSIMVNEVAGEALDLEKLFDESAAAADCPGSLRSWIVKPRETGESPLADYLQRRIKALLWERDDDIVVQDIGGPFKNLTPIMIEGAIKVSTVDLATAHQLLAKIEFPPSDSVAAIVACLKALADQVPRTYVATVAAACQKLEMPLAAVAIKHFGDICADADEWGVSIDLYRLAQQQLAEFSRPEWAGYLAPLAQIVDQSVAAAARILHGPSEAAELLLKNLEISDIKTSPLFLLNATHDEAVASSLSEGSLSRWRDRRAAILLPPLLLKSHNVGPALEAWLVKEYQQANSYFWETLRRQIALGSASLTRMTKAFYAACQLDDLIKNEERHTSREAFWMVVRLLLESGQPKWTETLAWKETIVQTYVDENLVEQLRTHASRHAGAILERLNVAVELANRWLEVISPDRTGVAKALLAILADTAKVWPASFFGGKNLGGRCLEILGSSARNRPEFRRLVSSGLIAAVVAKLREDGFWTGKSEALKAAAEYLDVLSQDELKQLLESVLELLDGLDPAKQFWPVVQPAVDILMSQEAMAHAAGNQGTKTRILRTVTRFGIQQKTEHARLLYYIHDFDLAEIGDATMLDALKTVVKDVRESAAQTNASNAIQNINALLVAPKFAERAGVDAALDALMKIINSALEKRPSISFAHAYEALRILAFNRKQIGTDANIEEQNLRTRLVPLLALIKAAWKRAQSEPTLFTSFSIPPSNKPNLAIVHNWALGSIVFADSLDERADMIATLEEAAKIGHLKEGIDLARATSQSIQEFLPIERPDPFSVRSEGRDAFYRALGSRLVSLQGISEPGERLALLQALLDQCLKLGPQGIDAAVFVLAYEVGSLAISNIDYLDYEKRLSQKRDLRVTLLPTLTNLNKRTSKKL